MKVRIIAPDKIIYKGEAVSLNVPGESGELTVLDLHRPLLTSLKAGQIRLKDNQNQDHCFDIDSGILEVRKKRVNILLSPFNF